MLMADEMEMTEVPAGGIRVVALHLRILPIRALRFGGEMLRFKLAGSLDAAQRFGS